jgi:ABC-type Fe3+ transport system permease subunit
VYVVDMGAMYLVPIILIICFAGLVLLSWMRDQSPNNKLISMLTYPMSANSSKGVKSMFFGFMIFAVIWCIWTSPLWLNTWENHSRHT